MRGVEIIVRSGWFSLPGDRRCSSKSPCAKSHTSLLAHDLTAQTRWPAPLLPASQCRHTHAYTLTLTHTQTHTHTHTHTHTYRPQHRHTATHPATHHTAHRHTTPHTHTTPTHTPHTHHTHTHDLVMLRSVVLVICVIGAGLA